MNKSISACLLSANPVTSIGDSKPVGEVKQLTKKSATVEHFSYLEKLDVLTQAYLGLNLPLTDALRAAEADLRPIARSVRT
jgi:hypothetical protein